MISEECSLWCNDRITVSMLSHEQTETGTKHKAEFLSVLLTLWILWLTTPVLMAQESNFPTPEQVSVLLEQSQEPMEMVLQQLHGGSVRLVAVGEQHRVDVMEAFGLSLFQTAAEEGLVSFLSLEIDSRFQEDMDAYLREGVVSDRLQSALDHHHQAYRDMLAVAREYSIPVICADIRSGDRDAVMSENTLDYMRAHPDEVGMFYAGNAHITQHNGDILAEELGVGYYAVYQLRVSDRTDPLAQIAREAGIESTIGIDDLDESILGETTYGYFDHQKAPYGEAVDAVVIHVVQGGR